MKTVVELEDIIRSRADEDEAFRSRLKSDPYGAISEATGMTMPEGFSIHVHEESATDFHVVLPPASGPISDEHLRMAAGGFAGNAQNGDY